MSERLFGKLPKRTGWQPVLPEKKSAHLYLNGQEMIDHVGASVSIVKHRLGSTE